MYQDFMPEVNGPGEMSEDNDQGDACQDDDTETNFTCPPSLKRSSGIEACKEIKKQSDLFQKEIELAKIKAKRMKI